MKELQRYLQANYNRIKADSLRHKARIENELADEKDESNKRVLESKLKAIDLFMTKLYELNTIQL